MAFKNAVAATEFYIRATLKGSAALSAFTSTVDPQPLPREAVLPGMGYSWIMSRTVNTLNGVRLFTRLQYRIVAVGLESTIITLAEMDSIAQGLFGNGRESRVNVVNTYGTIATALIVQPQNFSFQDPGDKRLIRHLGFTCSFEVY